MFGRSIDFFWHLICFVWFSKPTLLEITCVFSHGSDPRAGPWSDEKWWSRFGSNWTAVWYTSGVKTEHFRWDTGRLRKGKLRHGSRWEAKFLTEILSNIRKSHLEKKLQYMFQVFVQRDYRKGWNRNVTYDSAHSFWVFITLPAFVQMTIEEKYQRHSHES